MIGAQYGPYLLSCILKISIFCLFWTLIQHIRDVDVIVLPGDAELLVIPVFRFRIKERIPDSAALPEDVRDDPLVRHFKLPFHLRNAVYEI